MKLVESIARDEGYDYLNNKQMAEAAFFFVDDEVTFYHNKESVGDLKQIKNAKLGTVLCIWNQSNAEERSQCFLKTERGWLCIEHNYYLYPDASYDSLWSAVDEAKRLYQKFIDVYQYARAKRWLLQAE